MHTRLHRFLLLLLLLPAVAWAQDGKVSGTVIDRSTGEPLPGATVIIEGTQRGTSTNIDGEYVLLDLDPGTYVLRASFVGFGPQLVQDVQVASGFTTVVDFSLAPGIELEEVVVQGQRLIRQDEVSTTTVLRGEEVQSLPVDNFQDAMSLAAGVVETNSGSDQGFHFRGGRSTEVAYIVDGVLIQDPLSGTVGGFDVARQSIDELQVLSGGFSAEYGKAMSGVILVSTPSGSNEWHGNLRFETDGFSMEGLGADGPGFGYERPFGNDWGTRSAEISLSGPILSDRITFFLNADRLDTDTYLNEFDGPSRPAVLPWNQLVGHTFMRTMSSSFLGANGQEVDVDFDDLGLQEGDVVTQEVIDQLAAAGVDTGRLAEAAISDFQQHHSLGLFQDRTRLTANLGMNLTRDLDARLSYKLTRRDGRGYDHFFKFLPEYNDKVKRDVDVFGAELTHRLSSTVFYELQGSYTSNRLYNYVYDEQLDADDPWRFGRIFSPYSVLGAFNTEGLSDAEGGSNYDFGGFSAADIYVDYPFLLSADAGRPLMLGRSLDLDGDGNLDYLREDRLTQELIDQIRNLFATMTDEELSALGLTRGVIPVLTPPTDNLYNERKIKDFQLNASISAQVNQRNFVKAGVQFRQLGLTNYSILANNIWDPSTDPSDPATKTIDIDDETYIDANPFELAAFVTDKIEFSNLVVQAGLRLDVLDPDVATVANYGAGGVLQRPGSANDPPVQAQDPKVKWRLSPRLGIAFPVTDRARLSFNYGQFLQYPEYNRMYESYRTATWVPGSGYVPIEDFGFDLGFETFIGNPDIDPEKTIFYQFDAEFLLSETFKIGAALFYKDIYDYVAVRRILGQGGRAFWVLDNLDYANTRGIEFRAEKRMTDHFGFTASYTFSRALGNADDYTGAFNDWYSNSVNGTVPPKGSQPLDWDQPHTLSFTVTGQYAGINLNLLGRFGSGLPYTPTSQRGLPLGPKNSARRPWTGTLDARLDYEFEIGSNAHFRPFVEVTNLLDRENVLDVFTTTGSPDFSLDPGTQFEDAQRVTFLGPPRHFEVGFQIGF